MLLSPISYMSMFAITTGMFFLAIPTFADPNDIEDTTCVVNFCELSVH